MQKYLTVDSRQCISWHDGVLIARIPEGFFAGADRWTVRMVSAGISGPEICTEGFCRVGDEGKWFPVGSTDSVGLCMQLPIQYFENDKGLFLQCDRDFEVSQGIADFLGSDCVLRAGTNFCQRAVVARYDPCYTLCNIVQSSACFNGMQKLLGIVQQHRQVFDADYLCVNVEDTESMTLRLCLVNTDGQAIDAQFCYFCLVFTPTNK